VSYLLFFLPVASMHGRSESLFAKSQVERLTWSRGPCSPETTSVRDERIESHEVQAYLSLSHV
jgi:hypothetical protein